MIDARVITVTRGVGHGRNMIPPALGGAPTLFIPTVVDNSNIFIFFEFMLGFQRG